MDVLMWNREPVGGPFALVDHTGTPRTDQDFRGKVLLVYFGLRSVDRVRREQFIKYIELSAVRHLVVEPLRRPQAVAGEPRALRRKNRFALTTALRPGPSLTTIRRQTGVNRSGGLIDDQRQ